MDLTLEELVAKHSFSVFKASSAASGCFFKNFTRILQPNLLILLYIGIIPPEQINAIHKSSKPCDITWQ